MSGILERLRRPSSFITLEKITWEETVEQTYRVTTERFVWSDGAEQVVEYEGDWFGSFNTHVDMRNPETGNRVEITTDPVYRETLDEELKTREATYHRSGWKEVSGDKIDGVVYTGKTKRVTVIDDD